MEVLLLFGVAVLLLLAFGRIEPPREPPVVVVQMQPAPRAGGGCLLALAIALLLFGFVLANLS